MTWAGWLEDQLRAVRAAGRWRTTRSLDALGPSGLLGGSEVTAFASNDYLGLSAHPAVISAARAATLRWGTGATASRLVVGNRPVHDELEEELAAWKGTEAALVFSTGYAANLSVLSVLGGPDATVFSDELNHASIIDGCRLSRSRVTVYRHGDLDHLQSLMQAATGRRLVVTDTVFSMDGDLAPVVELASVCEAAGALLVLDEAHAVLGPDAPVSDAPLVRVGTLSKTLGSLGGFVAADRSVVDLLVNRARPFIFSTGLTPGDAAAALAALRIVTSSEGDALRSRLHELVRRVDPTAGSPIVPVILGDEQAALDASAALLERGLLVPAIRPPTVPPGTSRLRLAISAAHTDEMLSSLVSALDELGLDR